MSSSKNLEYKKTSFLNKSNSAFIEQMYLKFINKDSDLPESWKNYFLDIGEEIDLVVKEINGPTWSPKKKKINLEEIQKNINNEDQNISKLKQTKHVDDIIGSKKVHGIPENAIYLDVGVGSSFIERYKKKHKLN